MSRPFLDTQSAATDEKLSLMWCVCGNSGAFLRIMQPCLTSINQPVPEIKALGVACCAAGGTLLVATQNDSDSQLIFISPVTDAFVHLIT